jgi:cyclohexa-1,5-dienecarbonyl-CoA hydratase
MATVGSTKSVHVEQLEDGAFWRVVFNGPKASVLDSKTIDELTDVFVRAKAARSLKVACFEGARANFSFGASVEEHLPDRVEDMLTRFHGLFRTIADASIVVLAAVRGKCLGGGLELASFCNRVFASPDAELGQPEIGLGVFAPVASLILPERIGQSRAEHLCLSGRILSAEEALAAGLVDAIAEDPAAAALDYARLQLLHHSATSLRCAVRAVRHGFYERFFGGLEAVERLYLEDLMATADAVEGIRSFLEKREPEWRDA